MIKMISYGRKYNKLGYPNPPIDNISERNDEPPIHQLIQKFTQFLLKFGC